MRLKKLGCKYFMHYGPWQEIAFSEEDSIVSIIGSWADEPKRSNRSGKSTLVEIILYGLYGKSRSKKEIDLINKNFEGEDMVVELVFDNDGEEVIIQRGRSASNQIILELTGHEGADKKVVQDEINQLVGLSYDDFIMTSFFMQGDIHTFMEAGATGQKQMIAKWLEKDYWKKYEKAAKEKLTELTKEINRLEVIAESTPDPLENAGIIIQVDLLENQKKSIETQIETLENQLENIDNQLVFGKEREEHEKAILEYNRTIKRYENQINQMQEEMQEWQEKLPESIEIEKKLDELPILEKMRDKLESDYSEMKLYYQEEQKVLSDQKANLKLLTQQYNEMKNFDNICPVMKRPCTAIETVTDVKEEVLKEGRKVKTLVEEKKVEVERLKGELETAKGYVSKAIDELKELKYIEKRYDSPSAINERIKRLEDTKWELNCESLRVLHLLHISKREVEKHSEIDIDLLKSKKEQIISEIVVNRSQLQDIITNIAGYKAKIEQNNLMIKRSKEALKEIKALSKTANLYKYIAFMFSKNGIPSNQVEVAFNEIEEETNIILEKINSDISIEFSAEREMNSWEENCLVCGFSYPKGFRKVECPECSNGRQKKKKDELSIKILTKGKEIDFNLESGGGKVLISLAIRLAFVRMLQRRLGVNLKLIVFDEIFGMLDDLNRNFVLRLLADTLINDFGFTQIFVISHEEEIRDVIPNVIHVTKYEEHSEFSWG